MFFPDLSAAQQDRALCAIAAAVKYEIPANIVLAVAEQEAGRPGLWVENTNGTYDVGSMQFNTAYLIELSKFGITPKDVAAVGCYSYDLAAWRLRGHLLHDQGDMWTRVADYHSRTPSFNTIYRRQIMVRAARWATWLEAHFVTHDVTPGRQPLTRSPSMEATDLTAVITQPLATHAPAVAAAPRMAVPAYVPRAIVATGDGIER